MEIKALRGTRDILPDEVGKWQYVEEVCRRLFDLYGYREIRTPIIEQSSLFMRSIGDTTDIVEKEMYTFVDRGKRSISLRPESTAPCVRAYLEHGFHKRVGFIKLYYMGPMFRSERPQAGRSRQFHHIGVEVLGSVSPFLDAEVISLLTRILREIGLAGYKLKLNTLGCRKDRKALSTLMRKQLQSQAHLLCEDCKARFERNVFRVLDCKKDSCHKIVQGLPTTLDNLCKDCLSHFQKVKDSLDALKIPYAIEPHLVRGLDYYTRTAFEIIHPGLGAKDAIAAGGRYDNLIADLGGPDLGAVGFAIGADRTLMALEATKAQLPIKPYKTDIFIATIGEEAEATAFALLNKLRSSGIKAEMDYENRSLKGQMKRADKLGVRFVALLGEEELKAGSVTLKDMASGEQRKVALDKFVEVAARHCEEARSADEAIS